jgi:exodeoxyribonuclease V alpha subunit
MNDEILIGTIRLVTFHNAENGYSILRINTEKKPNDDTLVMVNMPNPIPGTMHEFMGSWIQNEKYGWQFKAKTFKEKRPSTTNALEKYLGSGLIKGIGPGIARLIVKKFGLKTLEILDFDIGRLTEIRGINDRKLESIQDNWVEYKHIQEIMEFLQDADITPLFAVKIFKTYNNKAVSIISQNPYKLATDIYGIGFLTADRIACKLGINEVAEMRLKAGILYAIQNAREDGHCYLTQDQLLKSTVELLELKDSVELEKIESKILELISSKGIEKDLKKRVVENGDTNYYAPSIFHDEEYVASWLKKRKTFSLKKADKEKLVEWQKNSNHFNLSSEQALAIGAVENGFSILTGGPGCGKTTTTKAIVAALKDIGKTVLLAAPTGRAAQRMSEVIGITSKTIHRLLEVNQSTMGFNFNEANPLVGDFIIIDEVSMLDIHLTAGLLRAISDNTQVLFVGDKDQLPSVGAGSVLNDLIESGVVPTYKLTQVFRQAANSAIIKIAHTINLGEQPQMATPITKPELWKDHYDCLFIDTEELTEEQARFIKRVQKLDEKSEEEREEFSQTLEDKYKQVDLEKLKNAKTVAEKLLILKPKTVEYSALKYGMDATSMILKLYTETVEKYWKKQEIQILCPMSRGSLGTQKLNLKIQETINPQSDPERYILIGNKSLRYKDRVIQKVNNYRLHVYNGDIGVITNIDRENQIISVQFGSGSYVKNVDYKREYWMELELAYAISIHKSQGSEFPVVIIPIAGQHFTMLQRNLVYTALTRAKKLAIFVGNRASLRMAVNNNHQNKRQTTLKELLLN